MAVRAAFANGNLTSSSTWEAVDTTSYLNSESGNTALTTSYQYCTAFTPGAITIDGFAVKLASRAASPSGTITFQLFNSTGSLSVATVTVNISDLPTCTATSGTTTPVSTAEGGWFFVNIGTTVLLAATNYQIGVKTSASTQANIWTNGTAANWSRYLRSETTGAPAAGDDLIITGEWTAPATVTARTVTMDSTAATNYGSNTTTQVTPSLSICNNGTLTFGTSASTNYILQQSGHVIVYNGGTYSQGVSGTEIPRTSTAILQFNCTTVNGDFGLVARNGATVNMYGLSRTSGKNVTQTKLTANAAATATSITVADDTGWLSGDSLCFAPTTQTSTQFELKAATGNATSSTIAVAALTNAHSGTSPTQGEVGLLTRNNMLWAVTAADITFFYIGSTATVNCSWTDFRYVSTNATGKHGLDINTTTGTCDVDYCAIRDCGADAFRTSGTSGSGVSITNTIIYNICIATGAANGANVAATSGTWTINNCMFCGAGSFGTQFFISLADVGGTLTNCSFSGGSSTQSMFLLNEAAQIGTINNIAIHSNAASNSGLAFNTSAFGTLTSINAWRNSVTGISVNGNVPAAKTVSLVNCNAFGNGTSNYVIGNSAGAGVIIFDTCTANGDTTFSTTNGLLFGGTNTSTQVYMYSCNFSSVAGIKTKCTNDINCSGSGGLNSVICDNSILNGTNIFANVASLQNFPFLQVQNFGQVSNDNRTYIANGTTTPGIIQSNSGTVYGTNPLSEQMTPASASIKLVSNSILVPCASGKAATPIVQVQKNGSYNGNAARLIVKRQDSIGVTADTVLATFSAGSGSWQALTGTTVAALQNGVFQFVIDCDGTAGSVFVGDATATTA